MKKLISSIFLFISIISSSISQEVNVTSSFDTSKIFIGDQIKFTITVDQPSGLRLTLPLFKDTLCKNIEILSGPVIDSTSQDGRIKIIGKYLITSFDSGFYQIPPVFAEMKNQNGMKRFYSDYSQLEVMRVKIAPSDTTAKIYDIIKPYRAPLTIGEVLPWVLLVALLGALVWLAIRFIRKLKKSKTGVEAVIDPDPAHIIAFRELEKLREEQLWQKGEIKYYYTKLTEILRQYLENRFRVFSLELTTAETLAALVKSGFKKDGSYNQLKTVLTGADLVKFAKYNPEPPENESHFQNSWDFVLATKENEVITVAVDVKDKAREGSI
ncbi:MAG: hypothetical protein IMZ64_06070 [Bacteroidetes bacterium]|nr:hypothetical protein [Bacteroidota bacterium]